MAQTSIVPKAVWTQREQLNRCHKHMKHASCFPMFLLILFEFEGEKERVYVYKKREKNNLIPHEILQEMLIQAQSVDPLIQFTLGVLENF